MPQHAPKVKPQPKSKYRRSSQQQSASTPPPTISASISVHMSSPASSPTAFLSRRPSRSTAPPLTILPVPARTGIVVLPRALSHLQMSSTPASDDSRTQQIQRQAIRQGFCLGGPQQARTVSSQILPPLPNLPPSQTWALVPPHPMTLVPAAALGHGYRPRCLYGPHGLGCGCGGCN